MKVEMGIGERYSIMECLSQVSGTFTEMITCKALLKDVEISEKEMQDSGLRATEMGLRWDVDIVKAIEFNDLRLSLIKKGLMLMAEQGGLSALLGFNPIFNKLDFCATDVQALKALVDELDSNGLITSGNIDGCINVRGLG